MDEVTLPERALADSMRDVQTRAVGRYALFDEIAAGGMASVHLGRLMGPAGFSRTVAIKRLHPHLARDPDFVAMLIDEARIAARVRHPNVVPTLDVVNDDGELFLVMEYVHGESVAKLVRTLREQGGRAPLALVVGIAIGVLHGLHAAHEATDERGEPLGIVHRDVSPHNILVGADGLARVVDFGVAKARGRLSATETGALKGKIAYMAPEQLEAGGIDRRADVWAAGVVLWEAIAGKKLFVAESPAALMRAVTTQPIPRLDANGRVPTALADLVAGALARDRDRRTPTALALSLALEATGLAATQREIGAWVTSVAGADLARRAERVVEIEQSELHPASALGVRTTSGSRPPPALEQTQSAAPPLAPAPSPTSAPPPAPSIARSSTPIRAELAISGEHPSADRPSAPLLDTMRAIAPSARGASPREHAPRTHDQASTFARATPEIPTLDAAAFRPDRPRRYWLAALGATAVVALLGGLVLGRGEPSGARPTEEPRPSARLAQTANAPPLASASGASSGMGTSSTHGAMRTSSTPSANSATSATSAVSAVSAMSASSASAAKPPGRAPTVRRPPLPLPR
jgi:serine/threonine protein kinase